MPPRLNLLRACQVCHASTKPVSRPLIRVTAPFVAPQCQQQEQRRSASILSDLRDTPGAHHKSIRRGRGPASGKGKTSGRGHKGQKQHGKVPAGFQGGQTPEIIVHGKRGFHNPFTSDFARLNLDRIQQWIDQGRIDPSVPITLKELNTTRCVHGIKDGIKLLARNAEELRTPINIVVSRASAGAIAAVEKVGGTVTTRYYTPQSIKRITSGLTDPLVSLQTAPDSPFRTLREKQAAEGILPTFRYRLPDPASRKELEYYRDPAHRGYLSYMLSEGEGPSLYVKRPTTKKFQDKESKQKEQEVMQNRLW